MSDKGDTGDYLIQILKIRNDLNERFAILISQLTSLHEKLLQELQTIENVHKEETRTQRENVENLLAVKDNMLRMHEQTDLIDRQIQMCRENINSKRISLLWNAELENAMLSPFCKIKVTDKLNISSHASIDSIPFTPDKPVYKPRQDSELSGCSLNFDSGTSPSEFIQNCPPAYSDSKYSPRAADNYPHVEHSPCNEQFDAFHSNFDNMRLSEGPRKLVDKYMNISLPLHSACPYGVGKDCLRSPRGVAIDPRENRIYIADRANDRIQVFSDTGRFAFGFTHSEMKGPKGICIEEREGLVFLTLCDRNSIHSYTMGGKFVSKIGVPGCGPAQFNQPCGIAIDVTSRVYVCDFGNDRVQVFSKEFRYLTVLTTKVTHPTDVKVVADSVYVLDHRKYCVSVFSRGGAFYQEIIACGPEANQVKHPYFFDVDSMGNVLISDLSNNCIKVFSPKGSFLCSIGSRGEEPGQFLQPTGIALVEECVVTVCERNQDQLQIFQI